MEIYLIRHTKVNIGTDICYGASDVILAYEHLKDFEIIKNKLGNINEYKIFSSSLIRTKLLAEYLSKNSITTDSRLNELNFGEWEMIPWNKIDSNNLNKWMKDFENTKCPNGESFNDLYLRVTSFLKEILNSKQDKIIIVSHSGPIKAMIAYVLEILLKNAISIDIDYGSISKIECKYNRLIVKGINL